MVGGFYLGDGRVSVRTVSVERMREADRAATVRYGIPSIVLMENAGAACARVLQDHARGRCRVLVLAGEGNNGGDAYAAARHLHIAGYRVSVLSSAAPRADRSDALIQRAILAKMGVRVNTARSGRSLTGALVRGGWIVDGLYGTGLTREVTGVSAELIRRANATDRPILAIDIPSGLDATTGRAHGDAIRARITVALAAAKPGLVKPSARAYTGQLVVAEIGMPRELFR